MMHGSENVKFIKKKVKYNTGRPPYLQFQLSAVYRSLKKFGKLKK